MSGSGGPDEVLDVDITALGQSGVNLQELGAGIETPLGLYRDIVAAYPPAEAFGTDDQLAQELWDKVFPAMQGGNEIMKAFRGVLTILGQDVNAVGGAFDQANFGATAAVQPGPDGHGRH